MKDFIIENPEIKITPLKQVKGKKKTYRHLIKFKQKDVPDSRHRYKLCVGDLFVIKDNDFGVTNIDKEGLITAEIISIYNNIPQQGLKGVAWVVGHGWEKA